MSNFDAGTDKSTHNLQREASEKAEAEAAKRVLAGQIARAMEQQGLSKSALARRMRTSRSAVDRLLDPDHPSVTLLTLGRAACVLGKHLRAEFVD